MNPLADSSPPKPPVPPRSLSSLSPSAPPFSVDRPFFPSHPYSPLYGCPPWPSLPLTSSGWDFGGGKFQDDFDSDVEFDGGGGVSLSWMDPGQLSSFDHGISAETFIVPEDSTSSHWGKDPTSQATTLCGGFESSALFNENNSWTCTRNSMLPLYKHENSFSNQSELRQSHFDLQDKSSTMGTCKTDTLSLTGQLTSHSDSLIFNPSDVLSAQQQLDAVSCRAVSSPTCGGIKSGHSQHINPYKIHNYFDYAPAEKIDSIPTENEQDCSGIKNDTTIDDASFYSLTALAGSSIHSDSMNWKAMEQSSDLKFGSRILGMCLPSSSVSSYFSNTLDNSFPAHSVTLDQQNAVVDSPCWKGSVPSNQFGICNDANHVSISNDLLASNHGDQEQKGTAVSIESLGSPLFLDKLVLNNQFGICNEANHISMSNDMQASNHGDQEQKGTAISIESLGSSIFLGKRNSSFKETSSLAAGPELYAKPEKVEIESSVKTEVKTAQNCGSLNMIQEQDTGAKRKPCDIFGLKNHDMRRSNNEKNASQVAETATNGICNLHLNSVVTADYNLCDSTFDSSCARDHVMGTSAHEIDAHPNNSNLSGPFSFSSENSDGNVHLLFKAIHGLTEVLVSNVHGDANKLKKNDIKLLHGVLGNLKEYVHSEKKGSLSKIEPREEGSTNTSCHDSGVEASFFQDESKLTASMAENVHRVGLEVFSNSKPDFATRGIGANYRRCMAQAVEDVSKENYFEPKDDPQALLYKNLWIEAEVSLCKLKYELQFARMKLDLIGNKHHEVIVEGDHHDRKSSRLGKLHGTKEAECNKSKVDEFHKGTADDIASSSAGSDVDKFKILKGSGTLEEHMKHHEFLHSKSCSERENKKVILDGPSDTYQKKILQLPSLHEGHVHKQSFTNCKLNELNNDKKVGFDASVMARLEILKGRVDNLSSETVEGHQKFQELTKARCLTESVNQQPCTDPELASQKSAAEFKSSFQLLGNEHLGDIVQPPNFLGSANKVEYIGYEEAKPAIPRGVLEGHGGTSDCASGSILSEWEHIM